MNQVLLIVHVIISLCIIGLVMMQQGKGADAGAAFGGGGGGTSGSLFGASGASTFLSKTTAIVAVIFFSTSLGLAFLSTHKEAPVDLMAVDPAMIQQENDVPFIEDVAPQIPEDMPLTMDQDIPVIDQVDDIPATVN